MKIDELKGLIKTEMQRMFEADGYPIAADLDPKPGHPASAGQSKLMNLPGAPFGGNIYKAHIAILPNEAQEALKKWAKFCKWALNKYGEPHAWPAIVKQTAIETGRKFEDRCNQTSPATNGETMSNLPL
jgi:hypothetical protein